MNIFDLNIKKYAALITPPFLRNSVLMAFLYSFIKPLNELYQLFIISRKANLIKLKFNYQVCSLEYRLNDAFDPLERRIKIESAIIYDLIFLFTEAEDDPFYNKTKWLSDNPIYLRTEAELYSMYDFTVLIPDTNINLFRLRAEIDFYKLPSKQYKIEII